MSYLFIKRIHADPKSNVNHFIQLCLLALMLIRMNADLGRKKPSVQNVPWALDKGEKTQ